MYPLKAGMIAAAMLFGTAQLVGTALAAPISYSAALTGAAEVPPVITSGTGFATVTIDTLAHTLFVNVTFSGLTGLTTASHVHCCTVPGNNVSVATALPSFPNFPLTVTAGSYSQLFDTTQTATFSTAFINANGGTVAGAEAAFAAGLAAGRAYLNVHTTTSPGGEIRGFLTAVPEPATLGLLAAGVFGLAAAGRRRAT
jgi:hypothetical protein